MRKLLCFWVIAGALAAADKAPAADDLFETKLLDRIRAIDAGCSGVLGVYAIDLSAGRTIGYHSDSVFPQASSIKIPVMIEVFHQAQEGKFKLTDPVTLQPREAVGGSGHLRLLLRTRPLTLSVEDLTTAMIETSDNTATNRLIALVGMEKVNAMLDHAGFRQTRLRRIMLDSAAAERNEENVSSPAEMARIMELIYREKAVSPEASRRMIEILKLVNADLRKVVPASIPVASKPGELTGVRSETGVVFLQGRPFILSVGSSFLTEPENPVPAVARAVYEHFAVLAHSNRYGNGGVR